MSPSQTAYGDHAEFDQIKRVLVMTGMPRSKIAEPPSRPVTARDAFEYWQDQDALVAKGDVVILKSDGTRIDGDRVTSYFRDKNATTDDRAAAPKPVAARCTARPMCASTPARRSQTSFSDEARHNPNTADRPVLTGNVVITQNKDNMLHAAAAPSWT